MVRITIAITINLTIIYFINNYLSLYDENLFNCKSYLPFGLEVDRMNFKDEWNEQYDKIIRLNGITFITKGDHQYTSCRNIVIDSIIGYAFNDDKFVSIVKEKNNQKTFISYSLNEDTTSKYNYKVSLLDGNNLNDLSSMRIIKFDEGIVPFINLVYLFLIFLELILFYILFKKLMSKSNGSVSQ